MDILLSRRSSQMGVSTHTDSGSQSYNINIRTYLTDLFLSFFLAVDVQNPSILSFRKSSKAAEPWISEKCLYQLVWSVMYPYSHLVLMQHHYDLCSRPPPPPQLPVITAKLEFLFKSPLLALAVRLNRDVQKKQTTHRTRRFSLHCRI